ncbi:hypothetical protein ACES2J_08265 [Bdellovibrio bacteriovorus]|uniref:hypothetical protein n=1 Tax=Bdellovibrio bacteriovorus TaxID=959 RepID=UPI0035A5CB6E
MSKLSSKQITMIKNASAKGLIFYDHEHGKVSSDWPCDHCGKRHPKHCLSIHSSKEQMESDPMSGDIIFLGSACYQKLADELGLEQFGNKRKKENSMREEKKSNSPISQKQAVHDAILAVSKGKKITAAHKQRIYKMLEESFKDGKVKFRLSESNLGKLADERALRHYIIGLVGNWLRKDDRLAKIAA